MNFVETSFNHSANSTAYSQFQSEEKFWKKEHFQSKNDFWSDSNWICNLDLLRFEKRLEDPSHVHKLTAKEWDKGVSDNFDRGF